MGCTRPTAYHVCMHKVYAECSVFMCVSLCVCVNRCAIVREKERDIEVRTGGMSVSCSEVFEEPASWIDFRLFELSPPVPISGNIHWQSIYFSITEASESGA